MPYQIPKLMRLERLLLMKGLNDEEANYSEFSLFDNKQTNSLILQSNYILLQNIIGLHQ